VVLHLAVPLQFVNRTEANSRVIAETYATATSYIFRIVLIEHKALTRFNGLWILYTPFQSADLKFSRLCDIPPRLTEANRKQLARPTAAPANGFKYGTSSAYEAAHQFTLSLPVAAIPYSDWQYPPRTREATRFKPSVFAAIVRGGSYLPESKQTTAGDLEATSTELTI
jgi:hypothetical protein